MAGRFPFPSYPSGWFRVAGADEVPRGAVRPLRALGRDLVLLRTAEGTHHVFDAHCPHLGAHLGIGGRVVEGALQCPFHGWRYAPDGSCVSAPGATRIPPGARLRSWPLVKWCGQLLLWHHPDGRGPEWELPQVPEWGAPTWRFRPANEWVIRSHVQEFGENGMDLAHFPFLHAQQTQTIRSESVEIAGPLLLHRTYQRYTIFGLARAWAREVTGPLEITLVGPGCAINRASVEAGIELSYTYVFFFTPLDDERVGMRSVLGIRRLGSRLAESLLMRKAIREGARTIEQDIPIWENKRYRERPLLTDADGPIMQYRRWYQQFYPAPASAAPAGALSPVEAAARSAR
jgi:phenylpropionate dioxygenase-like ring-hydroxylating dioxygenase large terminal subunit